MRDRLVRVGFLGLILAMPVVIGAASQGDGDAAARPAPPMLSRAFSTPVLGVEMVVVTGLIVAARGRRRLLADPMPARVVSARVPVAARPTERAPVARPSLAVGAQ